MPVSLSDTEMCYVLKHSSVRFQPNAKRDGARSVSLRTQEIAIRMALGAAHRHRPAYPHFERQVSLAGLRSWRAWVSCSLTSGQLLPLQRQRDRPAHLHSRCRDDDAHGAARIGASGRPCRLCGPNRRFALDLETRTHGQKMTSCRLLASSDLRLLLSNDVPGSRLARLQIPCDRVYWSYIDTGRSRRKFDLCCRTRKER